MSLLEFSKDLIHDKVIRYKFGKKKKANENFSAVHLTVHNNFQEW